MGLKAVFRARSLVFLALIALLVTGCASSNNGSNGGIKTDIGVTGKTINLGILTPLSGPVAAPIGKPLTRGIEVFFDDINAAGGIDGYKVNLVEKDTQYDPQQEVVQYNAIHNQVLMMAESLGTEPTFAVKDLANKDNMLVAAATLSSDLARETHLILLGTPYRLQVENAFDYVVNKLGVKAPKTGIIYQNDDYGQDGLTGYKESITAYGLQDVGQEAFTQGAKDVSAQVLALKAAAAKYVFLTSVPTDTATIIATAAQLGYFPQWILQSPAFSTLLLGVPALVPLLSKAWVVGQGATWGDTSKPGMVQMLADIQKYATSPAQGPDGFFEFGYTEAKIVYAILKKAADSGDLTRAGVYKAYQNIGTVDLGGLYPTAKYGSSGNPNDRVPTRDNVIYAIDPTATGTGLVKPLSDDFVGTAAAASNF
ncbi:MAG TPA: ABC transporter substrate-binding protein [Ktedonobacterales bacterium]|nr:ABC transporter substrate-binding protein [Ktedonobacterales bacterium]